MKTVKYVKKANAYMVSDVRKVDKKYQQTIKWFTTKEEADERVQSDDQT